MDKDLWASLETEFIHIHVPAVRHAIVLRGRWMVGDTVFNLIPTFGFLLVSPSDASFVACNKHHAHTYTGPPSAAEKKALNAAASATPRETLALHARLTVHVVRLVCISIQECELADCGPRACAWEAGRCFSARRPSRVAGRRVLRCQRRGAGTAASPQGEAPLAASPLPGRVPTGMKSTRGR